MAEWSRVVNTTLINYMKKEESNIMRNRRLPAMLQDKGRVTYNWSGRETEQRIRYRRVPMTPYADMDVVTFARHDRWKLANLDIRGYSLADAVSKKERLMNKGEEAIIKLFSTMGESLKDDIGDQFAEEYYVDGNASGNTKKMHGIASFMGSGGSVAVVDGYLSPSDTFAGLSTILANYGGTWTGTWPDGTGDAHYDFWSPIIIDYTDASAWSDGATWALNCKQTIRHGVIQTQRSGTKKGLLDMIIMDATMYSKLLDKAAAAERIIVNRGEKSSKLTELGFRDVLNLDGVDCTWEYGITANTAFGFNCEQMETRSWQPQLFVPEGPDWDPVTKTWRLSIDFFGNTFWNPKYFLKMINNT